MYLCHSCGTTNLGNSTFLKELLINLTTFASEGDIFFLTLVRKHICPLSQREILSLASKAVCYLNILDKIVQAKTATPVLGKLAGM